MSALRSSGQLAREQDAPVETSRDVQAWATAPSRIDSPPVHHRAKAESPTERWKPNHGQNELKMRLGRNDPCPCGSGRKYKRCCLAADEQREAAQRRQEQESMEEQAWNDDAATPQPPPPRDLRQLVGQIRELARKVSPHARAGLEQALGDVGPLLPYMERQPEIEAASKALETHRAEFEQLADDETAYLARVRALFGEEVFAPLRFTAVDVQRAFEAKGPPVNTATDERFVESVLAAILHLADKNYRSRASMELMLRLPEYVAAGRWLDAWLLQHCAWLTSDSPDTSNPFLFEMFSSGYDRWVEQQRARDAELLQELGMDLERLQGMTLEQVDAWMQEQEADPAKKARIEALLLAHPAQQAQARASLEAMESDSVKLLEREDAEDLLLSWEEIENWLPVMNERWASLAEKLPKPRGDSPPDEATIKTVAEALTPLFREMAEHIFTPERIRELIAQLKAYRNERFAAGDKRVAGLALGAITYLQREDEPGMNSFLVTLCYQSLRRLTAPPADSGTES